MEVSKRKGWNPWVDCGVAALFPLSLVDTSGHQKVTPFFSCAPGDELPQSLLSVLLNIIVMSYRQLLGV